MGLNKRVLLKYIVSTLTVLAFAAGVYFFNRLVDSRKEYYKERESKFYSGCYTLCDTINRINEAGGSEYTQVPYEKIPRKLKEDYIKKNNLEKSLK